MKFRGLDLLFLALIAFAAFAALFHSDRVLNLVGIFVLAAVGLVAAWLALSSLSPARKGASTVDVPPIAPEQRFPDRSSLSLKQRALDWALSGSRSAPVSIILLAVGALPLLIYPFIFLAGIMSLVGDTRNAGPLPVLLITYVTLLGSLAYPMVYLPSAVLALRSLKQKAPAVRLSAIPLTYLAAVAGLFAMWYAVGTALGYG